MWGYKWVNTFWKKTTANKRQREKKKMVSVKRKNVYAFEGRMDSIPNVRCEWVTLWRGRRTITNEMK